VDASLVESIDTTPVAELPESSVESNPEPVINEAVTENLSDMVNDLLNAPGNAETE